MKKIIINIIKIIYLILTFLILIVGILSGLKNDLTLFIVSLLLIVFLFFIEKKYSITKHILKNKKLIIFLVVISIVLRLLLLLFNYGEVFSDEATFYSNAMNLSLDLPLNNRYIAMFPYLYSYIFFTRQLYENIYYKVYYCSNIKYNYGHNCILLCLFIW